MRPAGIFVLLAVVFGGVCAGQDRVLRKPGILRRHAHRRDRAGTDGHGVLPGLCVGIHRKLHSLCGKPCGGAGRRKAGDEPSGFHDYGVFNHCGMVAVVRRSTADFLSAEILCGNHRARYPQQLCAAGKNAEGHQGTEAHICFSAGVLLLY